MAKFNSYLLGKVRKSVGNITTCIFNKENIAKAKIFSRKDVKTPEILAERGENGNTSVSLPEDWDPAKVHAYCFATSKNGRMASDSRHLAIS